MTDEEKKVEIKFNVPLFSVDEYAQLESNINFHLEECTNEILKTLSKDKEVVILKKVIEKQQKKIEKLRAKNKRYEKYLKTKDKEHEKVLEYIETEKEVDYISKYKIKIKIKEIEDYMILFTNDKENFNKYKYARDILEKILKEN